MSNPPHALAADLPGWPCPPRVRDIATKERSWGGVKVGVINDDPETSGVVQDELGRLWANGDKAPRFALAKDTRLSFLGAILFWTEQGIGVYINPAQYMFLPSLSTFDMAPDKWVPIVAAVAADELPDFIQAPKEK